jgi:hypothetical protein
MVILILEPSSFMSIFFLMSAQEGGAGFELVTSA